MIEVLLCDGSGGKNFFETSEMFYYGGKFVERR